MQEQIRRFAREVPEREPGAPEGMLFVHPLTGSFVTFPALAERAEGGEVGFGDGGEERAVYAGIDEPVPVFAGHVGHEPGKPLPVEMDGLHKARLDQEVG